MAWAAADLRHRIGAIVRQYGDWVLWEKGLPCACHAASRLRMAAGCDRCGGEGFVWTDPRRLKAVLLPLHSDRRLASLGWAVPGDMTLGPAPHTRVHDFDRITLTTPTEAEAEVIERGRGDRVPGLAPQEDLLAYHATNPIACVLHDQPGEFRFEEDYVFEGKVIRWLRPPPDGTIYVVKYEALVEWLAFSSPLEVLDRGKNLGQRVLLRRRHLVNLRDPTRRRDVRSLLGM